MPVVHTDAETATRSYGVVEEDRNGFLVWGVHFHVHDLLPLRQLVELLLLNLRETVDLGMNHRKLKMDKWT